MKKSLFLCAAFVLVLSGCSQSKKPDTPPKEKVATSEEQHCTDKGGKTAKRTNPKGEAYGICVFSDGKQCEYGSLIRGECPDGGVDVSGVVDLAARYCMIRGGTYKQTVAATDTEAEKGNCTLKSGKRCDAGEYFEGECR